MSMYLLLRIEGV